jgi:uncharacterized protein YgiB involved in biofilm formation
MTIRPRKSSARVTLVLLGAAALASCSQDESTLQRDLYDTKEDCLKDWGDELKCAEQSSPGPTGSSYRGGYWYGPMYRPGQHGSSAIARSHGTVDSARPGSHSVGTAHISRGGFGGSASAHASGGS